MLIWGLLPCKWTLFSLRWKAMSRSSALWCRLPGRFAWPWWGSRQVIVPNILDVTLMFTFKYVKHHCFNFFKNQSIYMFQIYSKYQTSMLKLELSGGSNQRQCADQRHSHRKRLASGNGAVTWCFPKRFFFFFQMLQVWEWNYIFELRSIEDMLKSSLNWADWNILESWEVNR